MTDGRTDRRTELRWLRRAIAVPAVARKNCMICTKVQQNYYDTSRNYRKFAVFSAAEAITNNYRQRDGEQRYTAATVNTAGLDTRVRTQKTRWVFFWVHPPKKPTPQKTHTSTLT